MREYHTGALGEYEKAGASWERGGRKDQPIERPDPSSLPPSNLDGDLIDGSRIPPDLPEE